jgi:hypothetical protein
MAGLAHHQDVNIAVGSGFAASQGAENAHVSRPMAGGDLQYLVALVLQKLVNFHNPIPQLTFGMSSSSDKSHRR